MYTAPCRTGGLFLYETIIIPERQICGIRNYKDLLPENEKNV